MNPIHKKGILVLTSSFPKFEGDQDGNFILELCKEINSSFNKVIILCPHFSGGKFFESIDNIRIYRFPYFYPFKLQKLAGGSGARYNLKGSIIAKIQVITFITSQMFYAMKIIRRETVDIVHTHWILPQGLVGAICKKLLRIKHITTIHGSDINVIAKSKTLKMISRFVLSNSNFITANSSFTKSKLLNIDETIIQKLSIIPMGIDLAKFKNSIITKNVISYNSDRIILSVGILIDLKGTKYLIQAMEKVVIIFPKIILIIIGDGPEWKNLKRLAARLELGDKVIFKGIISNSELPKHYSSADIFVIPSIDINGKTEGLGVVTLEAMACGTPVIGSHVGGIPDVIKDGYNGFLVPEKSPEELADKIIQLLSDRKLAERFTVNGLKTVKENFSWNVVSERFVDIFSDLSGHE